MRDIQDKTDGTGDILTAEAFNTNYIDELQNVPVSADFTLDVEAGPDTDTSMFVKSIVIYVASSNYYDDTGAVNTIVLDRSGNLEPWPSYKDGMTVLFKAGSTNTGACTINVDSLGAKSLTDNAGSVLSPGDITAGNYITARYDSGNDRFELVVTPVIGGGGGLTSWEENVTTFRPVASGYDLGDSTHLLGDIYIDNAVYINAEDTGAALRSILGVDGSDICQLGNTNLATNINSDGTLTHNTVDMITSLLPAQATHAGEYLQTDGAGTLSWASAAGFTSWEENANDFRPITTKTGGLGDATHLIENAYIMDDGYIYFGDSQDGSIRYFTGGNTLYLSSAANMDLDAITDLSIAVGADFYIDTTGDFFINTDPTQDVYFQFSSTTYWQIANTGAILPGGSNPAANIGSTTAEINHIYQSDSGVHYFGSDQDMTVYHDGVDGYIDNGTGELKINTADVVIEEKLGIGVSPSTYYFRVSIAENDTSYNIAEFTNTFGTNVKITGDGVGCDASVQLTITGQQNFSFGLDGTDTYKFKLGPNATVSSNTAIVVNNSSNVGIGTATLTERLNINGNALFENDDGIQFKELGGTAREILSVDGSDICQVGNVNLATNIISDGTLTHNGTDFITDLLPAQATHSGEFLQTDGAGTLSWASAGGGSLTNWEENGNDLRPTTTKVSDLGDATHLIVEAYISDGGHLYLGDSQDMYITYTGAASEIYSTAGSLTLASNNNIVRLVANNTFIWEILTDGTLRPATNNAFDIGDSTHLIDDIFIGDNGLINLGDAQDATISFDGTDLAMTGTGDLIYNTFTVYNSNNFDIDDHLPAQATHAGEFLQTDGAGTLSWQPSLASWEENSDDLRPVVSGTGNLGDSTHLLEGAYFGDSAAISLGDTSDATITHNGTNAVFDVPTGSLRVESASIVIENSNYLYGEIVATTPRQLIGVDSSDILQIGSANIETSISAANDVTIEAADLVMENNFFIRGVETGSTVRAMLAMDASNIIRLGNGSNQLDLFSNGTMRYNSTTLASGSIDTTSSQTITVVDGLITNIA